MKKTLIAAAVTLGWACVQTRAMAAHCTFPAVAHIAENATGNAEFGNNEFASHLHTLFGSQAGRMLMTGDFFSGAASTEEMVSAALHFTTGQAFLFTPFFGATAD